jgi:ethanolamine kinase
VRVRLFGGAGRIARDVENATLAGLAEAGVGVPYHGRFGNGRVEGWLEGAEALALGQMADPDVSVRVARELAKLHAFELPAAAAAASAAPQPSMWPQLWSWLEQAQNTCHEMEGRWGSGVAARFGDIHARLLGLTPDHSEGGGGGGGEWRLDRVEAELVALERSLPASPAVFAHNDALAGNIMLDANTGDVTLIDFEYGGCNFRGFDIANHWNEWAGGTQAEMNGRCEYERFPSGAQQYAFAESYLRQETALKAQALLQTGLFNDAQGGRVGAEEEHQSAFLESVVAAAVDDAAVRALVDEANSYVQVNHWYWGLWAINQATLEGVGEFDYLTYAESRAQRYFDTKEAAARRAER